MNQRPEDQGEGNGQHRRASLPDPALRIRKRRPACERCNKRRTRCDGSLVGTPCSACKKSGNHETCAMIESKRKRGVDGRYTTHAGFPSSPSAMTDDAPGSSPASQSRPSRGPQWPARRGQHHVPADRQSTASSGIPGTAPTQPNIIGESWYASYVMRGYSPGHASHHRPLDDSNATVQSIAENMQSHDGASSDQGTPSTTGRPPVRQAPRAASVTDQTPRELPAPELIDRLIKTYFARFHTFCPILVRESFLSCASNKTVSLPLLCSVLFVASLHCDMEIIHLLGYSSRFSANSELMSRAVTAFDLDKTSDRTSRFLSSYLLHYWFGNPSAYRDSHWWFAASVRSAQCMGYHLSTQHTQMPVAERSRWKRVWWCLYVRDRQISLSTGTPMVINDADFDVEELAAEDLPDEEPETINYIIGQMGLNRIASSLYFLHCTPLRIHLSRESAIREVAMQDIQSSLQAWKASHPTIFASSGGNHHLSLTIKVCYNYYLINLTQRLQRQASKSETHHSSTSTEQIIDAATAVFALVEDSLLYWSPEYFPMIYVSALFSAMVVLAVDAVPPAACPNGEQLMRTIRPGLLSLKQFEGVYVLARWIRNFFMGCLIRWGREGRGSREVSPGAGARSGRRPDTQAQGHVTTNASHGVAPADHMETQASSGFTDLPTQDQAPGGGLEALAGFMLEQGSGPYQSEVERGDAAYWSGYQAGETGGLPVPESNQFQAMYFLADLGMPWME